LAETGVDESEAFLGDSWTGSSPGPRFRSLSKGLDEERTIVVLGSRMERYDSRVRSSS
jgi:hypothetical protein